MSMILEAIKWLSQLLIVSSGISALFSDSTRKDPHTHKRTLTTTGRITISTILVGFLAFGASDIADYQADKAKDEQSQQEMEHLNNLVDSQNLLIQNQKQLLLSQQTVLAETGRLDLTRSLLGGVRLSWAISNADQDALKKIGSHILAPMTKSERDCFDSPASQCQCSFAWDADGALEESCNFNHGQVASSPSPDEKSTLEKLLTDMCQNLTLIDAGGTPLLRLIDFKNTQVSVTDAGLINVDVQNPGIRFDQILNSSIAFKICRKRTMSTGFRLKSLDSRIIWDQQFLPPHWRSLNQDIANCDPDESDFMKVDAKLN